MYESFNDTILIEKKGKLNNYSLGNFVRKLESKYKALADYVKIYPTKTDIEISHYIDFVSFSY